MHPDRQIMHDAQRHAGAGGLGLGVGQLIVELPLQPPVEVDRAVVFGGEIGDVRVRGVLQSARPRPPIGAVLLGQCAPDREVVECGALPILEGPEGEFPARRPRHLVDTHQCRTLGGPGAVAVDGVGCAGLRRALRLESPDPAPLGHRPEFRDRLDPQV